MFPLRAITRSVERMIGRGRPGGLSRMSKSVRPAQDGSEALNRNRLRFAGRARAQIVQMNDLLISAAATPRTPAGRRDVQCVSRTKCVNDGSSS
jgi:hypothetical protein